ncbi:hypothetical protein R5R35_000088 [Gryllus longicercus]|uniref:Uncharacterized protein n=1 Tax=Gryllus longicercus TaxID=2509291 RepID=A0AAN9VTN5_9ORTH
METRNMRRKASEKQPLPGERRGTFGATAGGDSMRAGGDQELNRRALIGDNPEYTTAEHSSTHPSPLIAAPAASASQRSNLLLPETTAAGRQRRRMKWTIEINTFIMREYYTIT